MAEPGHSTLPPRRIVSLSPAATEILFAIGAGPQVVAADNWSTYPPEAPTTDLSGIDPNIEAITSYEPDLVVIANDTNDLVAGLTALDIPVVVSATPFDISGGYGAVAALGAVTGHVTEAREVIETMRADLAAALANAPDVPIRVYHELDSTYYAASSNSFIGAVYAALGTANIADEADTEGYGYPQLTEEYIIEADPQLIVITDLTAYTADDVAARPRLGIGQRGPQRQHPGGQRRHRLSLGTTAAPVRRRHCRGAGGDRRGGRRFERLGAATARGVETDPRITRASPRAPRDTRPRRPAPGRSGAASGNRR